MKTHGFSPSYVEEIDQYREEKGPMPILLTVAEAAEMLRLLPSSVYAICH